ncbi:MAG: glycosyltransferase family 2 protein [Oscillospiraceae bacterium]|nr:glycosyltransferase family 2 protein [Oscillospiraceae bacterium]
MQSARAIGLVRKGISSLRTNGWRITWRKTVALLRATDNYRPIARQPLFSEAELAEQRRHVVPRDIRFSIIVPLYNTPERFLREMMDSVLAQTYGGWQLCLADGSDGEHGDVASVCREYMAADSRIRYRKLPQNLGISGNTNAALALADGEYIALLDHDDVLHPAALYEVMRSIERTGADFIYTDESIFHKDPRDAYMAHCKPAFAPDTLRSNNYICHFTAFQRSLLDEAGLFDPECDGSQGHDMVLRLTEKARRVAHIPEVLYYWRAHGGSVAGSPDTKPYVVNAGVRAVEKQLRRLGLAGTVAPAAPGQTVYRIRYAVQGSPKVSILIPNYEHLDDLRACLTSIFEKTTWPNYEIVIVENNSTSPALFAYYEALQQGHDNVRVVTWEGAFNYSAINNFGARYCTGDYLLLLNNDTVVITPDWLQEMLMFAQRGDVGAVGAMLYYADGTVQHAGVTVGLGSVAGHPDRYVRRGDSGYFGRLLYAQNLSAVTGACLMVPRAVWDTVGGLDEGYAVAYNDVDLCLRIREAGYLIVWTPHAELYHCEYKSRGLDDTPEKRQRYLDEVRRFRTRWAKVLEDGDPYYNPNLSTAGEDYSFNPTVGQYDAR